MPRKNTLGRNSLFDTQRGPRAQALQTAHTLVYDGIDTLLVKKTLSE